jgi:hypothetical protein
MPFAMSCFPKKKLQNSNKGFVSNDGAFYVNTAEKLEFTTTKQ